MTTEIPYDTINARLHGIVRTLNELGAETTGSCYGMQDEDGNDTDDWYVEFTLPYTADGWRCLRAIAYWLVADIDVMLYVWPISGGDIRFNLQGRGADIAEIEKRLTP